MTPGYNWESSGDSRSTSQTCVLATSKPLLHQVTHSSKEHSHFCPLQIMNHGIPACPVRWSVPDQPPDQCLHSPLISACQSLITA